MAKTRTEQPTPPPTRLVEHLKELRLPAFRDHYQSLAERAAKEPSILAVLTQENFLQIMREKPALSAKLLLKIAQLLSQRLRLTSGILVDYLES